MAPPRAAHVSSPVDVTESAASAERLVRANCMRALAAVTKFPEFRRDSRSVAGGPPLAIVTVWVVSPPPCTHRRCPRRASSIRLCASEGPVPPGRGDSVSTARGTRRSCRYRLQTCAGSDGASTWSVATNTWPLFSSPPTSQPSRTTRSRCSLHCSAGAGDRHADVTAISDGVDAQLLDRAAVIVALAEEIETRCGHGQPVTVDCTVDCRVTISVRPLLSQLATRLGGRFEHAFGRPLLVRAQAQHPATACRTNPS